MKKFRPIDIERVREVLSYDPDTGVFIWRVRASRNVMAGDVAGCLNLAGYIEIGIDGLIYKAHRLAYALSRGEDPAGLVDHIDGVITNNVASNLRCATSTINAQNRRGASKNAKSSLIGAFFRADRGHWTSSIVVDGKRLNLGRFPSDLEAHEAYVAAKRKYHEGCTI